MQPVSRAGVVPSSPRSGAIVPVTSSVIRRAGRAGVARTVCVALGNRGSEEEAAVLAEALSHDPPLGR